MSSPIFWRPTGSSRPTFMSSASWAPGMSDAAISDFVAVRSACSRVPRAGRPSIPKMPAMITSSVMACMRGARENGRPIGQESISRSVMSAIICA